MSESQNLINMIKEQIQKVDAALVEYNRYKKLEVNSEDFNVRL